MPVRNFTPEYKTESPYSATTVAATVMGYYVHRPIQPRDDDIHVIMDTPRYVERPDLLAHDFYGDANLWWVFGVRNGLEDPVHDIKLGVSLALPSLDHIRKIL